MAQALVSRLQRIKIFEPPIATWGIIAALLLLSAAVGARSFQFYGPYGLEIPRWALGLFGLLGMVGAGAFAIRNMEISLALLVFASATVDLPISTGTSSAVNLTILMVMGLTGLWVLRMLLYQKRISLVPTSLNWPILGFVGVAILSWFASYVILDWRANLPGNAIKVQAGQFMMFALSAAAFLLIANHRIDEPMIKRWTWVIIILGALAILSEILFIWPPPLPAVQGAMKMWPFVLLVAHLLFNPAVQGLKWHLIGWPILGMWAYWWLAFPWIFDFKGGWAPAFLAIGFLFVIRWPKLSIISGAVVLLVIFGSGMADEIIAQEAASGTGYRPLIWKDVVNLTSTSWLFGLGPVNYMYSWTVLGVDSLSYQYYIAGNPGELARLGLNMRVPSHNMYVDIFAQVGLLGLGLFLIFSARALYLAWRLARRFKPGFLQAHAYGVLCGFASLLIGSFSFADWLLPFVYNITISGFRHSVYTWILLGTLVAIDYSLKDEENEESS